MSNVPTLLTMKILDIPRSGSHGGITSSHNRAGQYVRSRRTPVQPVGNGRRGIVRANFGAASSAWAALATAVQAAWTSWAASHPITDALGQSVTLTGQQAYVTINAQLLNCGQAQSSAIPVSSSVFSPSPATFTAVHAGAITLTPGGGGGAADFLLYAFSPLQSGGVNFCKNFQQFGKVAGNSVVAIVATTAYNTLYGSPIVGQKIFYRLTPVNQYGVSGVPVIGQATAT
jgi:hypothetical protein